MTNEETQVAGWPTQTQNCGCIVRVMPEMCKHSVGGARLGYATTLELIRELLSRADISFLTGEAWPMYRTVDETREEEGRLGLAPEYSAPPSTAGALLPPSSSEAENGD